MMSLESMEDSFEWNNQVWKHVRLTRILCLGIGMFHMWPNHIPSAVVNSSMVCANKVRVLRISL